MGLPAYWIANYIVDIAKVYVSACLIITVFVLFKGKPDGFIPIILLYPIAIVPFTSLTSFMFKSEMQSQILTYFGTFAICGVAGPLVFLLQAFPATY